MHPICQFCKNYKKIDNAYHCSKEYTESIEMQLPENETIVGPDYRIINGSTYMNKQFKEIELVDLENYKDKLEARKTKKAWEMKLINDINDYLAMGGHDETAIDASEAPFE